MSLFIHTHSCGSLAVCLSANLYQKGRISSGQGQTMQTLTQASWLDSAGPHLIL